MKGGHKGVVATGQWQLQDGTDPGGDQVISSVVAVTSGRRNLIMILGWSRLWRPDNRRVRALHRGANPVMVAVIWRLR